MTLLRRTANLLGIGTARLLDLILPPHCVLCRVETRADVHVCEQCLAQVPVIEPPRCGICSRPFEGMIAGNTALICAECHHEPPGFDCAVALRLSRGPARELLHRFKYGKQTYLRHHLAAWLLEALHDPRLQLPPPTALVAVPLHRVRERKRGFNQSVEVARIAARKMGIPLLFPLERVRFTLSQTRLDRSARMENLRNAFALRQNADLRDHHLILIDDVLTTGSTLSACARLLRAAGAASVRAAAVLHG